MNAELDISADTILALNGNKASANELLKLGDVISIAGAANPLQLIQVE